MADILLTILLALFVVIDFVWHMMPASRYMGEHLVSAQQDSFIFVFLFFYLFINAPISMGYSSQHSVAKRKLDMIEHIFGDSRILICRMLMMIVSSMIYIFDQRIGLVMTRGAFITYCAFPLMEIFHEICNLLKRKNLKKIWRIKSVLSFGLICMAAGFIIRVLIFLSSLLEQYVELMVKISICINVIIVVSLSITAIMWGIFAFHDWKWSRKQISVKSMTRECVARNMAMLKCSRFKRAYIEGLLLQKVQLTGQWPDDMRPKFKDDKLELLLAKLDCLTLESYNYLF